MNEHQKELFKLVKEVDAFCKEHDITYYCAGGTVIGAVRHGGFIPWDDDIDIYMTRSEFHRFLDAFQKYGPKDRKMEMYEAGHQLYSVIGRYVEEGTTMFCHYHIFGHASAGTLIDIFVLDPIPNDYKGQREFLAKQNAYADFVSPTLSYSHRLPEEHFHYYDEYVAYSKEHGYHETIQKIADDIFCYDEDECDYYALRWGTLPLIYPKKVIGKPVYLPFEDMMVPVPEDWYKYLVIHYGSAWMNLPYVENMDTHTNIKRKDISYEYFYQRRDEYFTQEYLFDLHFQRKDACRETVKAERPIIAYVADLQCKLCLKNLEVNFAREGVTPEQLRERQDYEKLIQLYRPYLEMQTKNTFRGTMSHTHYYRWLNPIIIPLPSEQLEILMEALLFSGDLITAEKIVGIYERGNVSDEVIERTADAIDRINEVAKLYYTGAYEECRARISASEDPKMQRLLDDYLWLCRARLGMTDEQAVELKRLYESGDSSDEIAKAYGDYLYAEGQAESAARVYQELMAHSRNGLFWNDIDEKGIRIPPIPLEKESRFIDTPLTAKQKELLDEIISICDRHDIKYVITTSMARRMFLTGNIGYSTGNRIVFMDAANAEKFLAAFKQEKPQGRKLMSWETGDAIQDFAIFYTDTGSIYCNFKRLDQWRNLGIYIKICILRSENAPKAYQKEVYYKEFLLNLTYTDTVDSSNLKTKRKILANHVMQNYMSEKRQERMKERFFEKSLRIEKKAKPGKYYTYQNTIGMRPKKVPIYDQTWMKTEEIEIDGRKYCVPKETTASHMRNEPDLGNVPPNRSMYTYRTDDLTWDDINPLIDQQGYDALDWDKYAVAKKKERALKRRVDIAWKLLLKEDDEITIRQEYAGKIRELEAVWEKKDLDKMGAILAKLDNTVREYFSFGIPVYLEDDLKQLYSRYLHAAGHKKFAARLEELWAKDRKAFYNNV